MAHTHWFMSCSISFSRCKFGLELSVKMSCAAYSNANTATKVERKIQTAKRFGIFLWSIVSQGYSRILTAILLVITTQKKYENITSNVIFPCKMLYDCMICADGSFSKRQQTSANVSRHRLVSMLHRM